MVVPVRRKSGHQSISASPSSSPHIMVKRLTSCCHRRTTLLTRHFVPTWFFLNSILASKRKPNSSFSSECPSPIYPSHAVTAKNTELHGKVSSHQVRAARYFSQEKVWRKLCPPKAGIAELLQHLWFDPL